MIAICRAAHSRAGYTIGFSAVCSLGFDGGILMGGGCRPGRDLSRCRSGGIERPWKQYQGLAIGSPAMQALVHSLDTMAGFLLIGPLIGCVAGVDLRVFWETHKNPEPRSLVETEANDLLVPSRAWR